MSHPGYKHTQNIKPHRLLDKEIIAMSPLPAMQINRQIDAMLLTKALHLRNEPFFFVGV